jgi:hypothetical protein
MDSENTSHYRIEFTTVITARMLQRIIMINKDYMILAVIIHITNSVCDEEKEALTAGEGHHNGG